MIKPAILFALANLVAPWLNASTLSFTGNLNQDDSIQLFSLRLDSPGLISAQTLSFGGGVNAAGTPIAPGGFAPVLSLFDGNGLELLLAYDYSGVPHAGCGPRSVDPSSGFCWDAYISVFLPAGTYTLALTEDDNLPLGPSFSDGFLRTGEGNFTGPNFLGTSGSFILVTGEQRSSTWALDVTADAVSEVPEPAAGWLIGSGLLLAIARGRRLRPRQ